MKFKIITLSNNNTPRRILDGSLCYGLGHYVSSGGMVFDNKIKRTEKIGVELGWSETGFSSAISDTLYCLIYEEDYYFQSIKKGLFLEDNEATQKMVEICVDILEKYWEDRLRWLRREKHLEF